ncbi:MAG: PHP-associated domain-containing protein, partial [Desulfocurvibacter africanus]
LVEGHDVVLLGETLPERSPRFIRTRDLEDMLAPVREQVFAFVAHPFRYTDARGKRLERILALVDGIEMSSVNILRAGFSGKDIYLSSLAELYEQARRDFSLVPVWATDAHSEEAVGALATQIPGRVESMADLVAALKRGETQEYQNRDLLWRILS